MVRKTVPLRIYSKVAFAEDVCIQIEKLHQAADGSYTASC